MTFEIFQEDRIRKENSNFIISVVILHQRILSIKYVSHWKILFQLNHKIPHGRIYFCLCLLLLYGIRQFTNSQHIRAAQLMASLSAQPPRMSARVTGITGLDKPICPTARTHLTPNWYSQTEYHRPLLPKKQTPNQTVSRQFCPASVYACSLFRNFHTVFEFAAFGNSFRQFVKVAVLKLYFFKSNMLQIQFFEYTPVEYHICQFYFRKLQM